MDLHIANPQGGSDGRFVTDAIRSPDGKLLVVGISDGNFSRIYVYALPAGKLLWEKSFLNPPESNVLSPDGQIVAVGFYYLGNKCPHIMLLRAVTGKTVVKLENRGEISSLQSDGVGPITFSHDGKLLGAALQNEVRVWAVATGKNYISIEPPGYNTRKGIDEIQDITFSPDDHYLAGTGTHQSKLYIWHLPDGKPVQQISVASEPNKLTGVIYNGDGTYIAVGSIGPTNVYKLKGKKFVTACHISPSADGPIGPAEFNVENNLWVMTPNGMQLWGCAKDKKPRKIRDKTVSHPVQGLYVLKSGFAELRQSDVWRLNPYAESTLSLVDMASNKVLASVALPGRPEK